MNINSVVARVEHIKPLRAADNYTGQENFTFLRCHVTTDDGLSGTGVTGRFLADQVAHLLNGGMAATLKDANALEIEAINATLTKKFNPRSAYRKSDFNAHRH